MFIEHLPCARYFSKYFMFVSFSKQPHIGGNIIILPILQMKRLRHRELKFHYTRLHSYKVAEPGSEPRSTQVEAPEPALLLLS